MKTWFTKWKISNALDEGKPLPPSVQRAMANSAELRRFAENTAALDETLKNTRPAPTAPSGLHAAVLRAVRSAENAGAAEFSGWEKFRQRLIPVSALGLLMILGLLGTDRYFRPPPVSGTGVSPVSLHSEMAPGSETHGQDARATTLALASSTLETGDELVQTAPTAALAPLSDEMLRLNRDVINAQNYLLASLP